MCVKSKLPQPMKDIEHLVGKLLQVMGRFGRMWEPDKGKRKGWRRWRLGPTHKLDHAPGALIPVLEAGIATSSQDLLDRQPLCSGSLEDLKNGCFVGPRPQPLLLRLSPPPPPLRCCST